MAYEFKRRFRGVEVNKVLTIEASGIAIATLLGDLYDVPVVFAKKSQTANSTDDKYISHAYSFTHKKLNDVFISKPYLHATDKVLIVDDFLADGEAAHALIDLVKQAGGEIAGIGIAIEKGQQKGGAMLRKEGYQVESIAIIESMDWQTQTIHFRSQAVPFGLQHVLAMFVANITPIIILANVAGVNAELSAALIQNCMVVAGIGTLVQLYPVWRIGSRLPIVMGISFTFLSLAIAIATTQGMGTLRATTST